MGRRGGEGGRENDRFCHVGLHGLQIKRRCAVNVLSNFLGLAASLDTVRWKRACQCLIRCNGLTCFDQTQEEEERAVLFCACVTGTGIVLREFWRIVGDIGALFSS